MPRPFTDFLRAHRNGLTHDELADALNELVAAVTEEGKSGTLTFTVSIKPMGKGDGLEVAAEVKVKPRWGDFRAEIVFRFTGQWTKWKAIDGRMLSQVEFAEFIEDNLHDVVSPAGAEMLEIAQYLSATRSVDFKSAIRLSNGQIQFHNLESMDAKVGVGQTQVPETITLGIAPVFGLSPFRVEAKFRYRLADGKLRMGIKLHRVEDVMAAVVNDMVHGVVGSESRMGTVGIVLPPGAVLVEGVAPDVTK